MIPNCDLGTYCMHCGKHTEKGYIFQVVWHPFPKRKFLQAWCVECLARADQKTYEMVPVGFELDRDDKIIGAGR